MYALAVKPDVDKTFAKLVKKDRKQLLAIGKKIEEIRANPHHVYKFLRKPLQRYNRVHIDSNFVLIFRIDHNEQTVTVYAYDHHDAIYKWRPASDWDRTTHIEHFLTHELDIAPADFVKKGYVPLMLEKN